MKTLPTLRDKKRYIAFEVKSEEAITRDGLLDEVLDSLYSLFGDAGCSEINLSLMSFDGRYGVVRCARAKTTETRAALACVNNVMGNRVSILVLGISGTVRGAASLFPVF